MIAFNDTAPARDEPPAVGVVGLIGPLASCGFIFEAASLLSIQSANTSTGSVRANKMGQRSLNAETALVSQPVAFVWKL